ncbi:MAG: DNA-methyltransferase [Promethearchaeota archaeon]
MPNEKILGKAKSETSSFGVPKRENHNSIKFYDTKLYKNMTKPREVIYIDNSDSIPRSILDKIIHGDSQNMKLVPDNSVHLMITSPPYNVTKDYDDNLTLSEYLSLLKHVFEETWRVLVAGGRAAINIANVGRKPYIPLHSYVIQIMLEIGFHMRGEIIWNKGASAGVSCAWGSFASASNPCLRDVHEYILVFSKLTNKLERGKKENTIKKDNFIKWTKSIWSFPAVSAKKIGHPAPFPVELPRRLMDFYSYKGNVVLDPFIGSGSTAIAAIELDRHFIGYENSLEYVTLANKRINEIDKAI